MDAHLALELHYEDKQTGEKGQTGTLPLLYLMKRLALALQPLLNEKARGLEPDALEMVLSEAFLTPFSPRAKPLPKDTELEGLEAMTPFSPGRVILLTPDGDLQQERVMTDSQAEEVRRAFNLALRAVADDPARFDHPLLLGTVSAGVENTQEPPQETPPANELAASGVTPPPAKPRKKTTKPKRSGEPE